MKTRKGNVVNTASPMIIGVLPFNLKKKHNKLKTVNSLNVIHVFESLHYLLRLFGLKKVSISGSKVRKTRRLSAIYSLTLAVVIFSGQIYAVYYRTVKYYDSMQLPSILVDLLNLIPSTVTVLVSLIFSSTKYRIIFVRLFRNFQAIDSHLNIHVDKDYFILKKKITHFLTFIIVTSTIVNVYDYFIWKGDTRISLSTVLMTIKELTLLEASIYFYLIIIRFDDLNLQLETAKYDSPNIYFSEIIVKTELKRDAHIRRVNKMFVEGKEGIENQENLTRLLIIFDKLADNVNIINSCFGLAVSSLSKILLILLLWYFVTVFLIEVVQVFVYGNLCKEIYNIIEF